MRILLVSHGFLPNHPSGTEIYTYEVGRELRARGHEVHVFTTEKDIGRKHLSVHLREYRGIPVHELTNNLFYASFRETWDYPPAARSFGLFLDDLRPDVVHFMHLLYLSVGCVEEAAARGIPAVFTLHDYWLQCARYGQRIHADGSVCHDIDFDRCGNCLATFKYGQTRVERATAKAIASVHDTTGVDLGDAARWVGDRVKGRKRHQPSQRPPDERVDPDVARDLAREVASRDSLLRERLLPHVKRFLAPSRFLRDRFVEWGVPEGMIDYLRTGIDLEPFEGFERVPSDRVRVAYIGTLAPHKGVHLLLEAWGRVDPALRERGELTIWGPASHNPSYRAELQRIARRVGSRLAGRVEREDVADVLAHTDLLVVPSVWYENSPLIILEALATRTPLFVSDLGGMAELVDDGRTGLHFRVGDVGDLAAKLERVLGEPRLLEELSGETSADLKPVGEDARQLEELYRGLGAGDPAPGAAASGTGGAASEPDDGA